MTTTRDITIRAGAPSDSGWRPLVAAAGADESSEPSPASAGGGDGEPIAALVHLSDFHICDAESPARLAHLFRHGLPGAPYRRALGGDVGSYRPNEILTSQVATTMVATINELVAAPASGRPFDAAVLTGDLTDNAQANEVDWFRAIVGGGEVAPASGDRDPANSEWFGAPTAAWHESYWHPYPDAPSDWWRARHGFPTIDGLLAAARRPFTSPGLDVPLLAVNGNHDVLLEGAAPADDAVRALAEGDRRPTDLPPGRSPLALLGVTAPVGPATYLASDGAPFETITADARRRLIEPGEFNRNHAIERAHPVELGPGHAWTAAITTGPHAVRMIAIDTVNPYGGWQGSIGADQLRWLRATFAAATEPYLVVASHHPSWTLFNAYTPPGDPTAEPRVLADDVLGTFLAEPRVIAWLAGHVHHHSVTIHRGAGDRVLPEITSAALLDWPQQSRTLEVLRPGDGTLRLVSTAIDHHAPLPYDSSALDDPVQLAALSRQLSRNIPRFAELYDPLEAAARRIEQNTTIVVPDPAP